LTRLIALQTEFFQKGNPTPDEIRDFQQAGRRTRELFAQMAQSEGSVMNCQIEHGASDSDVGTPCSNRAVATCADCGAAICSACRTWCCGESFCEWCGDYHVKHNCLRKPIHAENWKQEKTKIA
jgi:hypothetical protein